MKPNTPETEKNFSRDVKTFERLPPKTKELSLLKDRAKKTTGRKAAALHQLIRAKSK